MMLKMAQQIEDGEVTEINPNSAPAESEQKPTESEQKPAGKLPF